MRRRQGGGADSAGGDERREVAELSAAPETVAQGAVADQEAPLVVGRVVDEAGEPVPDARVWGLTGVVWGAPPVDMDALTELIAAVSRFGAAAAQQVAELDLNPVLAGPDGAVAVDWLLIQDTDR